MGCLSSFPPFFFVFSAHLFLFVADDKAICMYLPMDEPDRVSFFVRNFGDGRRCEVRKQNPDWPRARVAHVQGMRDPSICHFPLQLLPSYIASVCGTSLCDSHLSSRTTSRVIIGKSVVHLLVMLSMDDKQSKFGIQSGHFKPIRVC